MACLEHIHTDETCWGCWDGDGGSGGGAIHSTITRQAHIHSEPQGETALWKQIWLTSPSVASPKMYTAVPPSSSLAEVSE